MSNQSYNQSHPQYQSAKDLDGASMTSTATSTPTVSLLKKSLKQKFQSSPKDSKARKEAKEAAARSTIVVDGVATKKRQPIEDTMTPRQRTAEAYMVQAIMK